MAGNDELTRREMVAVAASLAAMTYAVPMLAQPMGGRAARVLPAESLAQRASKKGLLCGSAIAADVLANDPQMRAALRANANILVPGHVLKWWRIQGSLDGPLNFGPAEQIYSFAQANGMKMRGHCLSWWEGNPDWITALVPTLSVKAAGDLLQRHVHQEVSYWRGRAVQWDVVNEPIDAKNVLDDHVWADKLGETYIDLAFEAAHDADPNALLVLNAVLVAQIDPWEQRQQQATLGLLERLVKRGVPIQGFGFECHLRTLHGFSQSDWTKFLDRVTGLGLKLMLTELDVDDAGTSGDIGMRDAASATLATEVLDATLSYQECLGVLCWGLVDKYSWLRKMKDHPRPDGLPKRPSPLDDNYQPKALWWALSDAIDRAAPRR